MDDEYDFVSFNGYRYVSWWPERIRESQLLTHYIINGKEYERVKYDDEKDNWSVNDVPCHDCGVLKGQFHVDGCDVEECPACKGQVISCECLDNDDEE
ncbi:MAG: hypothetical protein IEMM0008_0182 [bacterium]|nr:MAG: hypothetical protein IEMM0008_0182 [bacterium]